MERLRVPSWVLAGGIAVVVIGAVAFGIWGTASGFAVQSSDPTVTQLQRVGELVVLRASVADVLATQGHEYRGSWLVKGDALLSVDMRQARFQSVAEEAKKIVVLLPAPRVIQPRVDHEKTRTWDVDKATWKAYLGGGDQNKLRDESMREAQRLVYKTCTGQEMMDEARAQTVVVLRNMYRFVGWKIDVVWQDGGDTSGAAK